VGIAYALHRVRVSILRARFRLIFRERNHIARDLHDTVLQGFAGTLYLMKAALLHLEKSPGEGRQQLARAVEQANLSLKEARQSLAWLRLPALEDQTLSNALRTAGKSLVANTPIQFDLQVTGRMWQLPYEISCELYTAAREAIHNAVIHANPSRITVTLAFASHCFRVSVEDDGAGFDVSDGLAKRNHWGLIGMQERVRRIHGEITIASGEKGGTRVEMSVRRGLLRRASHQAD